MEDLKSWARDIKRECPKCKGDAIVDCNCDNGLIKCKKCKGTGERISSSYVTDEKESGTCTTCDGNGRIHCHVCQGEGYITNENNRRIRCLKCNKGATECRDCGGTGSKYETVKTMEKVSTACDCNDGYVQCKKCDHNNEAKCPRCKGKGEVHKLEKIVIAGLIILLILKYFGVFVSLAFIALALVILYKLIKYFTDSNTNNP